MWNELDDAGRVRFANAMYVKMPRYRRCGIHNFFDTTNRVYNGILNHESPLSIIYLSIIQFVRNIIKHANDYNLPHQVYTHTHTQLVYLNMSLQLILAYTNTYPTFHAFRSGMKQKCVRR